jgi:hypothetical protein
MRFLSSAGIRKRRVDDSLPFVVTPATVTGQLNSNPNFGYANTYASAVRGMTLVATPAVWDDADGTPAVRGFWVNSSSKAQVAGDNVHTFVVPEDAELFTGFLWAEVATQGGSSVTRYFQPVIRVIDPPAVPFSNGVISPILGSPDVGATLTKAVFSWWSPLPFTRSGQWVKNGTLTGVTSDTYSDTAEGDIIQIGRASCRERV